ncbi:MAG: hypothetical protein K2X50_09140 [Gammaproteobacteria bacterium]|nr:hypothetical protein [Gammaproteobacteria bacterium]
MTTLTKLLCLCIGLLLNCSSYAVKNSDYNLNRFHPYQTLHVSISTQTNSDCSRLNVYHPYGKLLEGTTFPYQMDKHETATFILSEGFATGPDVTLTYKCGSDTFSVRAWQSQCWLVYGCHAHGEIISTTDGLIVDTPIDIKNASRIWNEYGEVHFTVRNK